jgi:hypothetical protein
LVARGGLAAREGRAPYKLPVWIGSDWFAVPCPADLSRSRPSVLCDGIGAVTEFMVRWWTDTTGPEGKTLSHHAEWTGTTGPEGKLCRITLNGLKRLGLREILSKPDEHRTHGSC